MFAVLHYPHAVVVEVSGDLDLSTAPSLSTTLDLLDPETDDRTIIVSLEACSFCDSSGLAALIKAKKRLGDRLSLVLARASQAYKLLAMTQLTQLFGPFETLALALGRDAVSG